MVGIVYEIVGHIINSLFLMTIFIFHILFLNLQTHNNNFFQKHFKDMYSLSKKSRETSEAKEHSQAELAKKNN